MGKINKINVKLPARASIWYLGASAIAKAIGFLVTPFFTRMISGQAYGELTVYLTLVGIGSICCSAITGGNAIYMGIRQSKEDEGSFLRSALLVSVLSSLAFCTVLFAFSSFWAVKRQLMIPLVIQILCDGIIAVFTARQKFFYRYKEIALMMTASSVLPAVLTLALLKIVNGKFSVRIYSLLAISLGLAIYSLVKILGKQGRVKRRLCILHLKTALPLIPHSTSTAISSQGDKLIITHFLGTVALAKYAVIHSLGIGLQFAVGAVGFALGPWIIRRLDNKDFTEVSYLSGFLLTAFSALSLVLVALAPEAMRILAPKEYFDAYPALLPIALSTPLMLLNSIITICLIHFGKGGKTALSSVIGALSGIILNFTFISKLSYLGAGLSLFLSHLIDSAVGLYLLLRVMPKKIIGATDLLKNLLLTSFLGVMLLFLFNSLALRVLLLPVPAIMLLNVFYNLKRLIIE